MVNNTAILNCIEKKLYLCYADTEFIVDLTEGDLEDNWNSIQFSEKSSLDVNFWWDENDGKPTVCLYGLEENPDGTFSINTKDERPLKITNIIGTKADYFDLPYQEKYGNDYKVFHGTELLSRTRVLNSACELVTKAKYFENKDDVYIIGIDKNGARQLIVVPEKYDLRARTTIRNKNK